MAAACAPRYVVLRILATAVFLLGGAAAQPAHAGCQLRQLASLPVAYSSTGNPVVAVTMLGHTLHMMVDTGAMGSFLSPAAFAKLNLYGSVNTQGFQGEGVDGYKQINNAVMEDVVIGHAQLHGEDFVVGDFGETAAAGRPAPDGLLGYDIMQSFDIGFDLPDNLINFYDLQDCATPALPWGDSFDVEPFVPRHDHLAVPQIAAQIDDKSITLLIDSGATVSFLLDAALIKAAITPAAVIAVKNTDAVGVSGRGVAFQEQQFASYAVGAEEFDHAWIRVITHVLPDLVRDNGGMIGDDYLAHHRVYFANDTATAYLSLTVAPVAAQQKTAP